MKETYAAAGVDIDLKSKVISKIAQYARSATRPEVLSGVGFFGGLFDAIGGGGWGPTVATAMVGAGGDPRTSIGTTNTA